MPHTEPGHERTDVSIRPIVVAGTILVAVTLAAFLVVAVQLRILAGQAARRDPAPSPLAAARPERPPEPRLQTAPGADLQAMRAAEEAALGSYGWVDRQAGLVRIPLARAQELLAAEAR
jgi:hypothetical protein